MEITDVSTAPQSLIDTPFYIFRISLLTYGLIQDWSSLSLPSNPCSTRWHMKNSNHYPLWPLWIPLYAFWPIGCSTTIPTTHGDSFALTKLYLCIFLSEIWSSAVWKPHTKMNLIRSHHFPKQNVNLELLKLTFSGIILTKLVLYPFKKSKGSHWFP